MNAVIEQKLRDLMEESLRQCAPAAHVVAHLLLACYLEGKQNDFAKWACQYSPGVSMKVGVEGVRSILPGELPIETDEKEWLC
jgi:hypothetical protein